MTDLTKLVIAGFLSASVSSVALTASADTQPTTGAAGTETETTTGAAGTETDTTTGAAGTTAAAGESIMDGDYYEDMIEALKDVSDDGEDERSALEDADSARIVTLSELRANAPEHHDAIDEALEAHEDKRDDYRSAIEDNDDLKEAVENRGFSVDDVVAVKYDTDNGEVTLVVDAS
jgi:hypothetical protein